MRWNQTVMLGMVAVLVGCDCVTSSHPVGDEVSSIEISDWEGQWSFTGESGKVLVIEVEDPTNALLKVTTFPRDSESPPPSTALLRSTGDDVFVSIAINPTQDKFLWFKVANHGDSMLVWLPDAPKLGQLVDDGVLPGKTVDRNVELEWLSAENLALIASEEEGVLFDWKNPWVLRRVSR